MKNKILAILLTIVMLLSMLPMSAFAADTAPSYVALGDSISTGYGLADKTAEGFTYLLADELGYELTNLAADGNTAAGILAQLQEQSYKDAVADADVITITVGGNDLMALLYSKVAEQTSSTTDTAADIPAKLQSGDYEALVAAINLLTESREMYIVNDEDFPIAINGIIANLNAIITKIRSVNSHAEIVVATQYNPYVEFENAVLAILSLSAVYKGMEAGVNALNTAIVNNAAGKYTVSNVKAAFDAYTGTEDLYNAQPPAGAAAMNVDFHPTAAGHKLLADTLAATFETLDISSAPTTVTVEAPYDTMMFAGVTGAGEYEVGESVTLTATTFTDGYDTVFYYWLDNSVELSDYPTEAELKAAIVSYSPTFTFTAAENVSYTPIADYDTNKLQVYVEGCLFEDDNYTAEGDGWGYTTEYDQVLFAGDEEITVSLDSYPETLTVEDKLYLRVGFALWDSDGEGEGSLILVKDTSITIPTAPIYNSVEYWNWCNRYASITVAYLLHAHNYEIRFDEEGHWEECACGDKTAVQPHSFTDDADTTCDCGYERHVHTYETKYDANGHWTECACKDKTAVQPHSFSNDADTTCDCGFGRHVHTYETKFDENGHWTKCACGDKTDVQPHSFANDTDTTCDCGYTRTVELPVTIMSTYATITYTPDGFDLAGMFAVDLNAGAATYTVISGGTGEGTVNGSKLSITKSGTFVIKVTTAKNGVYLPGEATATLTVEKATPEYTVPGPFALNTSDPLSEIDLPNGFAWEDPEQRMTTSRGFYTNIIYTPEDTDNYEVVVLNVEVRNRLDTTFIEASVGIDIEQEVSVIADGKLLNATVKVDFRNESEVPVGDAEKIRNYANANFSGKSFGIEWIDISLKGEDGNPIRELDSPLAFGFDTAGRNVLGIASVHNGTLVHFDQLNGWDWSTPDIPIWASSRGVIGETDLEETAERLVAMGLPPETAVLFADCFSTYAIIYEVEPTPDTPSSPQTGDNSRMALWLALLFISGGAVITLTVYDRKRRNAVKH